MKRITLGHGKVAIVDDEDFDLVSRFTWHLNKGYARTNVYLGMIGGKQKQGQMLLHQLILRPPKGMEGDHRNHDKLDCRRENLRICTHSQNLQNQARQEGTNSRFKGVCWHKGASKWNAQIMLNGKNIHLGYFQDEVEAALAYDTKATELFGKFACLNEIDGAGRE